MICSGSYWSQRHERTPDELEQNFGQRLRERLALGRVDYCSLDLPPAEEELDEEEEIEQELLVAVVLLHRLLRMRAVGIEAASTTTLRGVERKS